MKEIKHLIREYTKINPFSGQIRVAKQNETIARFECGYRNFETKAHFLERQLFPIASITKQFTAVGILLNAERRKLDINQTLNHYLMPNHSLWQGSMPEWAQQITIHHLLTNSSGLPNYYFHALFRSSEWRDIDNIASKDLYGAIITKVKNIPLEFIPGSKFVYNDFNYLLLGLILAEIVPDHNVSGFYQKEIFNPLGLSNSFWPSLEEELAYIHNIYVNDNLPRRYAVNYRQVNEKPSLVVAHEVNVPCGGSGHIFSTCDDLLKWNYALHSGKILKQKSLDLMCAIHIGTEDSYYLGGVSYGYGIIIDTIQASNIYSHPGSFSGISTYLSYDPLNQTGMVILSNFSISNHESSPPLKHPGRVLFKLIEDIHCKLRD